MTGYSVLIILHVVYQVRSRRTGRSACQPCTFGRGGTRLIKDPFSEERPTNRIVLGRCTHPKGRIGKKLGGVKVLNAVQALPRKEERRWRRMDDANMHTKSINNGSTTSRLYFYFISAPALLGHCVGADSD
mmetsp:Transcript_3568/g.8932  ORF Transcript_3568/g.8932 Transcript_3568/m.8932 type:complete len:131 (+) Transcript_3568:69-461(+)